MTHDNAQLWLSALDDEIFGGVQRTPSVHAQLLAVVPQPSLWRICSNPTTEIIHALNIARSIYFHNSTADENDMSQNYYIRFII